MHAAASLLQECADSLYTEATHRPDVIELPVEDAHSHGLGVGLDAAPVCGGRLVAPGLDHLQTQDCTSHNPATAACSLQSAGK